VHRGRIAQALYGGVPEPMRRKVYETLDEPLGNMTRKFNETYGCP
jgi:hypothetical protein